MLWMDETLYSHTKKYTQMTMGETANVGTMVDVFGEML